MILFPPSPNPCAANIPELSIALPGSDPHTSGASAVRGGCPSPCGDALQWPPDTGGHVLHKAQPFHCHRAVPAYIPTSTRDNTQVTCLQAFFIDKEFEAHQPDSFIVGNARVLTYSGKHMDSPGGQVHL